jgi:CHAT domain
MAHKPLTYRDFNLEMSDLKDDGMFTVRVLGRAPGGEMRADEAEHPTYKPDEFKTLQARLERSRINLDLLKDLGAKLAALLLPGRVGELFKNSLQQVSGKGEGLRLRLHIEPLALAALPWEYTFVARTSGEQVGNDFLALRREVSITRYETIGPPLKPLEGKDKLRIVAALASPLDQPALNVEADKRAIEAAIASLKSKTQAVDSLVLDGVTRERLLDAIDGCDIFHFAGHGVFEQAGTTPQGQVVKKGKIILETADNASDPYDSELLATNLGNAGVRLVVLGACSTAARDEGGAWTGVAPALVRENIPAVVAMQYPVGDVDAGTFAAYLYRMALGGYTIDEAVFEARQAMISIGGLDDHDWGLPAIYLRAEDGFLFPLPPEEPGVADSPVVTVQRKVGIVSGEDITAHIREMVGGRLDIHVQVDEVKAGGKSVGLEIDTLGGSGSTGQSPRTEPDEAAGGD